MKDGIGNMLMKQLYTFKASLGGVILSFSHVSYDKQKDIVIHQELNSLLPLCVSAKCVVFTPVPQSVIYGEVKKMTHYGLIATVLGLAQIRFKVDALATWCQGGRNGQLGQWKLSHDGARELYLAEGDVVSVTIGHVSGGDAGSAIFIEVEPFKEFTILKPSGETYHCHSDGTIDIVDEIQQDVVVVNHDDDDDDDNIADDDGGSEVVEPSLKRAKKSQ